MSVCDCCHEEWESSFFCDVCSSEPELVERRRPVLIWDYIDGHDYEDCEEYVYRSVCLNCCAGHAASKPETVTS